MNIKWKIAAPAAVIVLIAVIFGITQFIGRIPGEELALNDIIREERELAEFLDETDSYITDETALDEIGEAIGEAEETTTAPEAVDLSSILSEEQSIDFGSELDDFFSEEISAGELDDILSEF